MDTPPVRTEVDVGVAGGHLELIRTGVAWNAGFRVFRDLFQFGMTAILARLLAPEVYGQFALITSVTVFLGVLSFENLAQHILVAREEDLSLQDHFTASVFVQGVLFVIANAVAFSLRLSPTFEVVSLPLHLMSLTFLLNGPSTLRVMMLQRRMDWRRMRVLEGLSLVIMFVATVGMALGGAGVLALLVPGMIKDLVFWWDLFVVERWRPAWTYDGKRYREAISYAAARVGSGALSRLGGVVESGFLSDRLGFGVLGVFNRANALPQAATVRPTALLVQTVFPVFARVQSDPERVRRLSGMLLQAVAWAAIPLGIACALAARPGILLFYGGQWTDAVPLVPFALGVCLAAVVKQALFSVLLSGGRERVCTLLDGVAVAGILACLLILLPRGLPAFLAGSALVHAGTTLAAGLVAVWDGRMERRDARAALLPPLCGAAVGLAAALPAAASVDLLGPSGAGLAAASVYLAVHVVTVRLLFPGELERLLRLAPRSDIALRFAGLGGRGAA